MTCDHASRSVSATGETYCIRCGMVLGYASSWRPCGCVNDPLVFGHHCRGELLGQDITARHVPRVNAQLSEIAASYSPVSPTATCAVVTACQWQPELSRTRTG